MRLPVVRHLRQADEIEKEKSQSGGYGSRLEGSAFPSAGRAIWHGDGHAWRACDAAVGWQGKLQGMFGWADGNTFHAAGAFDGADLDQFVDGQMRGAGFGALGAVDAGCGVATDFDGAEGGDDAEQSAVGAEEAAPEVLDGHGEQDEGGHDGDANQAEVAEEVQHLHIGEDAEGSLHEIPQRLGGHAEDNEKEEGEQQVLEAAEGDVEPARKLQVAAEEAAAQLPEILRNGADGTKPGAEGFLEQQAGEEKDGHEDGGGGMDCGKVTGKKKVLKIHETGDGQPAIDTGGAIHIET